MRECNTKSVIIVIGGIMGISILTTHMYGTKIRAPVIPIACKKSTLFPATIHTNYSIYLETRGQMGNVLFQFASALAISVKNGRTLVIDNQTDSMLRKSFDMCYIPYLVGSAPSSTISLKEKNIYLVDRKFYALKDTHVQIGTYLQTWEYFKDIEHQLRQLLCFPSDVYKKNMNVLKSLNGDTFVGVHIRRGDKAPGSDAFFKSSVHLPPLSFTYRAMKYFRKHFPRVRFIVLSDDITWCKERLSKFRDVVFSENNSAVEDLNLMSLCNHTILHHGTFGWWGSWFANGKTIYYDRGYNDQTIIEDLRHHFLPDWIPMH